MCLNGRKKVKREVDRVLKVNEQDRTFTSGFTLDKVVEREREHLLFVWESERGMRGMPFQTRQPGQ